MKKLIIFGNGQIASFAYHYFEKDSDYYVEAFTVDSQYINKKSFLNKPLVPFENIEKKFSPKDYEMFIALSYKDLNRVREVKFNQAKEKKYRLASYINYLSKIEPKFKLPENCFVMESESIQHNVKIEKNVFIFSGSIIGHDTIIKKNSWITSGSAIGGNCVIGQNTFIGVNATIGHMVKIGNNNFIGASTYLDKSTKSKSVYIQKSTEKYPLNSDDFLKITKLI